MTALTKAAFARVAGISPPAVTAAIARGTIRPGDDGRIEPFAGLAALGIAPTRQHRRAIEKLLAAADLDGRRSPRGSTTTAARRATASARLEEAKARRAEIEVRRLEGTLVDGSQVRAQIFDLAREYRNSLQAWPARVAAQLAARLGVDARVLVVELEAEIRAFLEEQSAEPETRAMAQGVFAGKSDA